MARPIKNNADYFTHDSVMRNDPKIKALRRKFGHTGFSVWNMLLETLTDSDNFQVEYSELNIELMSGDFDLDPDELKAILEYCQNINLLYADDGFLFSKRLKERFSTLITKRERDRKRVFAGENTQSRVEYSKVKKSKVKEIDNTISMDDLNGVMEYFGFTEMRNPDKMKQVYTFLRILETDKRTDFFREQFDGYKKYKEQSGEIKHSFPGFLGSIEERYMDGGWNARNWAAEKPKQNGKGGLVNIKGLLSNV